MFSTKVADEALSVLVLGAGRPIPTFIKRRLQELITQGVKVTLVAEFGQGLEDLGGATIVRIGGRTSVLERSRIILQACLLPNRLLKLMSFREDLKFMRRFKWGIKYLSLLKIRRPDLIHIQWLAMVSEFLWMQHYFSCPIIASARGSQLTVYPATKPGYYEHIKKAITHADFIHCVSEGILEKCKMLGARSEKLFVNYNGINLKSFVPSSDTTRRVNFRIISVGGLIWRKGYIFHLLILKELIRRGRDKTELVIVGQGEDLTNLTYTSLALGISDNVSFKGNLPSDGVLDELQKSDVYLSCSIAEGLANGVLEAAACGLPVVSFECEGMREVIDNNQTGMIIPFGNIEEAVEAIILLQDRIDVRRSMSIKARKKVETQFDSHYWVRDMIAKYSFVIENYARKANTD